LAALTIERLEDLPHPGDAHLDGGEIGRLRVVTSVRVASQAHEVVSGTFTVINVGASSEPKS
jgi:hypothetical protein